MTPDPDSILAVVTRHYLTSGDFNGTPMRDIRADDCQKRALAKDLILRGLIFLNFGDRHPNPYVQALPPESRDVQLDKLRNAGDLIHICMYPTPEHLRSVVDSDEYRDRPFTSRLALGEHLFVFVPFDLRVLEHYRNDPRYVYKTDDIQGYISVSDTFYRSQQMKESDQVLVKQFGFGYDDNLNRCVMIMLCDLALLSPEHQQIWKLQQLAGVYKPHPNYYGSVMGHWPEKESIFTAFVSELQTMNGMASLMGRPSLFRHDFTDARPRRFGFLIRPTLSEFNDFVLTLDKMISENINLDFFQGEVALEYIEERSDGTRVARTKGSLRVLQEWLDRKVRFSDPGPKDEMMKTLKRVRKMRHSPAHALDEDIFDQQYLKKQRELMIDAYGAIRTLRLILANNPQARQYPVPDWLYKGDIWTY